jgi:membrane fusion protein (multidrug efflux system)
VEEVRKEEDQTPTGTKKDVPDTGGERPSPPGKKRNRIALIILILLAIIAAIVVYYFWHRSQIYISTDDAYVHGHIHTISTRIPGTIAAVYVVDNQMVNEGDILVKLDPATYEAAVKNAAAALDLAKNQVAEMQADVKLKAAEVESSKANLHLADVELKRVETLTKSKVDTQQQLDQAKAAYDVAAAHLQSAKEDMKKSEALLGVIPKSGIHPLVAQAQAGLEQARLNLEYTEVRSPVKGHVTEKSAETGNRMQPGQPLMSIVPLPKVWIVANYKETQLERVRVGQPVSIEVDTYPGMQLKGRVQSIMAGTGAVFSLFPPENATGNFVKVVQRIPVKIVLEEEPAQPDILRVGMSVQPTIDTTK